MSNKNILILGHSEHPPLAELLRILGLLNWMAVVKRTPYGEDLPDNMDLIDGVIIMGGPVGIYQHSRLEWLRQEISWVEQFLNTGKPVFGICLGCQMISHIHGGVVSKGEPGFEFGFTKIHLTADDPVFGTELAELPVFQAHGDTYTLQPHHTQLAKGDVYAQQAAKFADNVYGVQFHPEIDVETVTRWHRGTLEMRQSMGYGPTLTDLAGMKEMAEQHLPAVNGWLYRFLGRLLAV